MTGTRGSGARGSGVTIGEAGSNRLLASLPRRELGQVLERLRPVRHGLGEVLHEAGRPVEHVHFPLDGLLSLAAASGGSLVELAAVGNQGMVGVPVFLGSGEAGNTRTVCRVPGRSLALAAPEFRVWLARSPRLTRLMGAYVEVLLVEAAQSVACNRLHPVEERCARWLLQNQDGAARDEFPLTHTFMARMLGVRRASVTVAAGTLQRAGLITYRRGRVRILDRAGLEEASCRCNQVVEAAQERLLPPAPPRTGRR